MERMEPSQAQAALWVLTNVFDEVAKINLNSVQKYVPAATLHDRLFCPLAANLTAVLVSMVPSWRIALMQWL